MAFCRNCGSSVDGKFCPNCGTPIAAAGSAGPSPSSGATAFAGLADNVAGALCYVVGLATGILFLVLPPYNQNRAVRFHAFQSIFAHAAWIVAWLVLNSIGRAFRAIPGLGLLIWIAAWMALYCGGLAVWAYLMFKTYNNERVVLPVIGQMAEKQANS